MRVVMVYKRRAMVLIMLAVFLSLIAWGIADSSLYCPGQTVGGDVGSTIVILPQRHLEYHFHTTHQQWVQGHFTSNVSIALYIMTEPQFQTLNSTGTVSSFVWTTGAVTDGWLCSVNNNCPTPIPVTPRAPGYIVYDNPTFATAVVHIFLPIDLTPCYPPFTGAIHAPAQP